MEMVEKVSRALCAADGYNPDGIGHPYKEGDDLTVAAPAHAFPYWFAWRDMARAEAHELAVLAELQRKYGAKP